MKPLFDVLKAHHLGSAVPPTQVYEAIGYPPEMALEAAWANTCAIRMSIALVAAGVKIRPGHLRIRAGRFKDEMVEVRQCDLSHFLVHQIAQPEKFRNGSDAQNAIAWRRGIISFFRLHGTNQGHIDLISVIDWPQVKCSGSCYWDSSEVWFWPLK